MSLTRRSLLCLPVASALALQLAACDIPFHHLGERQVNMCEAADECGADAICVPGNGDEGSFCASSKVDLPGVIFEIRPAAFAKYGAGTSHIIDPGEEGLIFQNGIAGAVTLNPVLPQLVSISHGEVNCLPDEKSPPVKVPAKVEFTRVSGFVGLVNDPLTASSEKGEGSSFSFHLDVPPGRYDIYVQPESTPESPILCGGKPLPPVFIAAKEVEVKVNSTFRLDVQPPRNLTGTIEAPSLGTMSLDGWTLRVLEMNSGRLISDIQTISQLDKATLAQIDLHYNLTVGVSPVLQLSPPADVVAPSVFWDLAVADLQGDDVVELKLSALNITPRAVEGHVLDANASPVIAAVTLHSISLPGDVKNAAYMIATETNAQGLFEAKVPPGTYHVIAKPVDDDTLAISEATWDIPEDPMSSCFCGQAVTVPPKITLEAEVLTPSGEPLLEATAVASPSLAPPISYLDRQLGHAPELPRDTSVFVSNGQVSMGVDPGAFDFSVRPPEGTRYPWHVQSKLTVQPDSAEANSSVGTLTIAHPVVVSGVVKDPSGEFVSGAEIRAWLPVKTDTGKSRTVIEIGKATTDETGHYTIFLPPSIF